MANRPISRRKLLQLLKRFGVSEQTGTRGSHRMLVRTMPDGRKVPFTLPFHGDNKIIQPSIIAQIRQRFLLNPADGVSDAAFYSGRRS